ncbi:Fic family protein [Limibacter armeniacum]|uniref:Fic family protein n=1 Tax=Limibacter armeniacum TaxID=466084 RepID=UPI002FE5D6C5
MKGVEDIIEEYKSLKLDEVVDYDKFNSYTIVAHSTQIEGSTLTIEDTRLLLHDGLTPKGKPLIHSNMVMDHYKALELMKELVKQKSPITSTLIQKLNAQVMETTGSIYNTVFGEVDARKGEFRKGAVMAGVRYFMNYSKVPSAVEKLAKHLEENINDERLTLEEKINLSFYAHFELVSIHPFYDGNGRTSRLLMNYIQERLGLPMSIVFKEDKLDYIQALEATRENDDLNVFYSFMQEQYKKYLLEEIKRYNDQVGE